MFANTEEHTQFLKEFTEKTFNEYKDDKENFLCWERFWKFDLEIKYANFFNQLMLAKLENPQDNESIDIKAITPFVKLTDENLQFIKDIKKELNQKHNIKQITYEESFPKINEFFETQRNIKFSELTKEEQTKQLRHEDIVPTPVAIFDYLGLTHMQYKYLTQQGAVYN